MNVRERTKSVAGLGASAVRRQWTMEQWSILRQNLSQMSGLSRLVAGRLAKAKGPTAQLAVRRRSWMGAKAIPSAWRGPTAQLAVEEYSLE